MKNWIRKHHNIIAGLVIGTIGNLTIVGLITLLFGYTPLNHLFPHAIFGFIVPTFVGFYAHCQTSK